MVDPEYGHPTDDDLIERLTHQSGWRTRDVPHIKLGPTSSLLWDAIDEIRRLRTALAARQDGVDFVRLPVEFIRNCGCPSDTRMRVGECTDTGTCGCSLMLISRLEQSSQGSDE